MQTLHIAIDDTDSRDGRCTTHLAYNIVKGLKKMSTEFLDYPLLVRLNPNIPWKTRGNGAVCLRTKVQDAGRAIDYVRQAVEEGSAIGDGANPAVAFFESESIPTLIERFSAHTMCDVMSRQAAEKVAKSSGVQYYTHGTGQGLVGSLGAMGCLMINSDYTFEAIAYRKAEKCGTPRIVDVARVIEFSEATFPYTFNNYDRKHSRVLIAPHGPDPVFFGIRGESPEVVSSAIRSLQPDEELDGLMIFRSNQGTNMHLQNELNVAEVKSYTSGYVRCRVKTKPFAMEGGHVIFQVDQNGAVMPAAVYEPTGLACVAVQLAPGDVIEIGCGVRKGTARHPKILNVEYLSVLELAPAFDVHNPLCDVCGKRMKSEGRNKGYQCDKCKHIDPRGQKILVPRARRINCELHVPTPKAHRHLTKPIHRYGQEKSRFAGIGFEGPGKFEQNRTSVLYEYSGS